MNLTRRRFIGLTGLVAAAAPFGAPVVLTGQTLESSVLPVEDLMREHGVLRRVLLIYQEWIRRLDLNEDELLPTLVDSLGIIRSFIEDYHEKLEEDYLFPRFRRAGNLVALVDVLVVQHQAGRQLTDIAMSLANSQSLLQLDGRSRLMDVLSSFIRMYRPHAAREDTVLFPAFHSMLKKGEYDELGDVFEKKEADMFGEEGFEHTVNRLAAIERSLDIHELNQYTPQLSFASVLRR
jgi:hemerythrin-like domain-containing protein